MISLREQLLQLNVERHQLREQLDAHEAGRGASSAPDVPGYVNLVAPENEWEDLIWRYVDGQTSFIEAVIFEDRPVILLNIAVKRELAVQLPEELATDIKLAVFLDEIDVLRTVAENVLYLDKTHLASTKISRKCPVIRVGSARVHRVN